MPGACRGPQDRSANGFACLLNYVALTDYKFDHTAVDGNPEVRFKDKTDFTPADVEAHADQLVLLDSV